MGSSLSALFTMETWILAGLVVVAIAVQTSIGFGAMLVCVTVGSLWWSVPELTATLVPLTTLQTAFIVARYRHAVDVRLLLRWVLPFMGLGLVVSLVGIGGEEQPWMRPALGFMVLGLALRELWRSRTSSAAPSKGSRAASAGALVVAGLVHGVFATGGPPLVWSVGQEGLSKTAFRATLTAVFVAINTVMVAAFVLRGQIDTTTASRTFFLLVPLGLGVVLGEWLHHRVDEARFRLAVWGFLALAALPLIGSRFFG